MVTLSDVKTIMPQRLLDIMKCNGAPFCSPHEGSTRKIPGRHRDPPFKSSMPVERGGTMDRPGTNSSIW